MGKDIPHPLQAIKAVKYQMHEWLSTKRGFNSVFNDMEIDDFDDAPVPLYQLNLETQMAIGMTEAYQGYSDLMLMPTSFRHALIKSIIRNRKKENK